MSFPKTQELLEKYELTGERDERFPNFHDDTKDDYLEYGTEEYFDGIKFCVDNKLWPVGSLAHMTLDDEPKYSQFAVLLTYNGGPAKENYYYVYDILKCHPLFWSAKDENVKGDKTYAKFKFLSLY